MKLFVFYVALIVVLVSSWIGNLRQLARCDFEKPYGCEIVHIVGIIPLASLATVWFDSDQ